jgi:hypothetical protein
MNSHSVSVSSAYRIPSLLSDVLTDRAWYLKGPQVFPPSLTVGLEALYHHIPLSVVLPEVTEELFLLGIVLTNPLQTSLYPTIYVPLIECQTEVEDFSVVAVVVTYGCPARETLFPSPTG